MSTLSLIIIYSLTLQSNKVYCFGWSGSIFLFTIFSSFFSAQRQETALLVFSALAYVTAKTKCAVCAAGFSLQVTGDFAKTLFYFDIQN
jgi:hypothetical protein